MIASDDRGLLLGDGLFETLLVVDGRPLWWEEHVARLEAACTALALPAPDPRTLEEAAQTAIVESGLTEGRAALRLTWTAGSGGRGLDRPDAPAPRLIAKAAASPEPSEPLRLVLSEIRRNEGSPASRLKTLGYLDNVLARTRAREAGADDAVMLNNRGEIACASAANLFWLEGGRLFTPAIDCGVLAGIARAKTIETARLAGVAVEEVAEGIERLTGAEAAFLTNSLIGIRPAAQFEDAIYPPSRLVDELALALSGRRSLRSARPG